MKSVKICLVILFCAVLINFIRSDYTFHIAKSLPGCGGDPLAFYDLGGLILLGMVLWGYLRLKRK